jgi:hypothetical protein
MLIFLIPRGRPNPEEKVSHRHSFRTLFQDALGERLRRAGTDTQRFLATVAQPRRRVRRRSRSARLRQLRWRSRLHDDGLGASARGGPAAQYWTELCNHAGRAGRASPTGPKPPLAWSKETSARSCPCSSTKAPNHGSGINRNLARWPTRSEPQQTKCQGRQGQRRTYPKMGPEADRDAPIGRAVGNDQISDRPDHGEIPC